MPPSEPITEDPLDFEHEEEILQPEVILRHEDKLLCNGKVLRKYPVKFKNYSYDDARWMQEPHLKDFFTFST